MKLLQDNCLFFMMTDVCNCITSEYDTNVTITRSVTLVSTLMLYSCKHAPSAWKDRSDESINLV